MGAEGPRGYVNAVAMGAAVVADMAVGLADGICDLLRDAATTGKE